MSRQPSAVSRQPRVVPAERRGPEELRDKNRRVGRFLLGLFLALFVGALGLAIFGH